VALSGEHVVVVVEPNLYIHYPRAVLDVELCERALLLDLKPFPTIITCLSSAPSTFLAPSGWSCFAPLNFFMVSGISV
jgi:hypothetical protein